MAYIEPTDFVKEMIDLGEAKCRLSVTDTLIRAYMAGAILGLAAFFAVSVTVATGSLLVGSVFFPIGFIMLYLMKFDLLTGVFTLVPLALLDNRHGVTLRKLFRNWGLVLLGNFGGALTIAFLASFVLTYGFSTDGGVLAEKISVIGESRTVGYQEHGVPGWLTIFVRGMLCNWMVSMGVVGALISTSAGAKMAAMWMPVMLFFFMGFEHSVVNMFLFPFALIAGGDFTVADYVVWNELPTVLGNLIGGFLLVGLPLYITYARRRDTRHLA